MRKTVRKIPFNTYLNAPASTHRAKPRLGNQDPALPTSKKKNRFIIIIIIIIYDYKFSRKKARKYKISRHNRIIVSRSSNMFHPRLFALKQKNRVFYFATQTLLFQLGFVEFDHHLHPLIVLILKFYYISKII